MKSHHFRGKTNHRPFTITFKTVHLKHKQEKKQETFKLKVVLSNKYTTAHWQFRQALYKAAVF